ncbi:hypothetical protein [Weissella cibaria]|uniref:hypothetical protein n=1 Tax=Weissella cibaria TaxID=137591 RepID=UPI00223B3315|nr:hypothetical protein [Weissella cibaria]MCT0021412.1 hypothetical protein [Weissella cibaria]
MSGELVVRTVETFKLLKWQILIAVLFGVMCAAGALKIGEAMTPSKQVARTEFVINNGNGKWSLDDRYSTYMDMIKSDTVLKNVSKEIFGDSDSNHVNRLKKEVSAKRNDRSRMITLDVQGSNKAYVKQVSNITIKSLKLKIQSITEAESIQVTSKPLVYKEGKAINAKIFIIGGFVLGFMVWLSGAMFIKIYRREMNR